MVNHAAADDETSSPNNAHAPGATNASLIIEAAAPQFLLQYRPFARRNRIYRTPLGLKTGQLSSSKLTVKSNGRPLRIALAWSDPPWPALVNNLNLIVTAPGGRKFVGNQRRNGPPTLDGTNNAELVHVEKPAAGVWKVDVVGSNVARGPQDFALVSIGHF